jgi:4-amino-4-deoxy-L-arabinose transferase-like glycosyltransferase
MPTQYTTATVLSDLRILFWDQPREFRAIEMILGLVLLASIFGLWIIIVDSTGGELNLRRCYRRWAARRNYARVLEQITREESAKRREELDALARMMGGGR